MCDEPCEILDKLKKIVCEMERKKHRHCGPMWLQLAIVPACRKPRKCEPRKCDPEKFKRDQKFPKNIDDDVEIFTPVKKSKSRELRAGRLYKGCDCEMHNGLQDKCPRTECHGSVDCLHKPCPTCGPSEFAGGKHYAKLTEDRRIKYAQLLEAKKAELMKPKKNPQSGKEDLTNNRYESCDSCESPKNTFCIQYIPCPVCPGQCSTCPCTCPCISTCDKQPNPCDDPCKPNPCDDPCYDPCKSNPCKSNPCNDPCYDPCEPDPCEPDPCYEPCYDPCEPNPCDNPCEPKPCNNQCEPKPCENPCKPKSCHKVVICCDKYC